LWTAKEIERRYGSKELHALSVHPGAVATNLSNKCPRKRSKPYVRTQRFWLAK
jgi:hypothetical protein